MRVTQRAKNSSVARLIVPRPAPSAYDKRGLVLQFRKRIVVAGANRIFRFEEAGLVR